MEGPCRPARFPGADSRVPAPFPVEPHDFGFRAGVDLDRLNQLADELEAEESARKLAR